MLVQGFLGSKAGPGSVQEGIVSSEHERRKQPPIRWVTAESSGYLEEEKDAARLVGYGLHKRVNQQLYLLFFI